jgi:hypothetical protein
MGEEQFAEGERNGPADHFERRTPEGQAKGRVSTASCDHRAATINYVWCPRNRSRTFQPSTNKTLLNGWVVMTAYKFFHSKDRPHIERGSFRLGNLSHYRNVEDAKIRDDREGQQIFFNSKPVVVKDYHDAGNTERVGALGIGVFGSRNITIHNGLDSVQTIANIYTFCYSVGLHSELTAHWSNYDDYVEIIDPKGLGDALMNEGVIEEGSVRVRAARVFLEGQNRPVVYDAAEIDVSVADLDTIRSSCIFRKAESFIKDREQRIAFLAIQNMGPWIDIVISNPERYVSFVPTRSPKD